MSTLDKQSKAVQWLRIAFGYGAFVDLLAAIQMIFPRLFRLTMPDMALDTGLIFGLRYGAPLMLGWTVLLLWAIRKPLERKEIAFITIIPVMVGYTIVNFWMISMGLASLGQVLPLLISQVALYALLGYGYWKACKIDL